MRKWKIATYSTLLMTISSSLLYPQDCFLNVRLHKQKIIRVEEHFPLSTDSYDDILILIEGLESGELETKLNDDHDLDRINQFLTYLARQGVAPGSLEEALALEHDIAQLMGAIAYDYQYAAIPAVFIGQGEFILCKSWFKKRWDETKKFVKKHKKAILIGAAVVVAATVVVAVVVIASGAGAAAVAGAAGAAGAALAESPNEQPSEEHASSAEEALKQEAIEEQIAIFRENLAPEHFSGPVEEGLSLEEDGRILGSLLAHEGLKNYKEEEIKSPFGLFLKESAKRAFELGSSEADSRFATDFASLYQTPDSCSDFDTIFYQARGEKALSSGYLNQAVQDFGKVIDLDSANPAPYLERAVAHLGLGEYDRSLEDYRQYISHVPTTYPLSVSEFSLGFAKGLPKGVYDSAEGLFLLISDLITYPIHTGGQVYGAFAHLGSLAANGEWNSLSETLAPEVHRLIKDWETIPSFERGELAGYAFGKYGADILIPGGTAKIASKGIKSAKELTVIYKGLQTAEKTLVLESVASLETSAKIGEVLQAGQKSIVLGEELGFTTREIAKLKQVGKLESVVTNTLEETLSNPATRESFELFKKAQDFLKPYSKTFMSEVEARELIHQTGIRTFPRPEGVPDNFRVRVSDKGGGMLYVHPTHSHTSIRVMPGKPHSSFPYQQKPYVIQMKNGKIVDKFGNAVAKEAPEAHIPIEDFFYSE